MKNKKNKDAFILMRDLWCETCDDITSHSVELLEKNSEEVEYRRLCNVCKNKEEIQQRLNLKTKETKWIKGTISILSWKALEESPDCLTN